MLTYRQQLDLVERKFAVKKTDGIFDTFKYHRRVMYDYLWDKERDVWECRGHVYDNRNGNLVQAAPRKSFNYLENNWWSEVPLDTRVNLYRKINGFMAAATMYEGQLVVSTTGSTSSDFAQLARGWIGSQYVYQGDSTIFEIVDPSDQHIVDEKPGAYVLGYRDKHFGVFNPALDQYEDTMQLKDAIEYVKDKRNEGFMVYYENFNAGNRPCKMKTPYYVHKKKLMRMNKGNVELMYKLKNVQAFTDPVWKDVVSSIVSTVDCIDWLTYDEQTRRKVIERILP